MTKKIAAITMVYNEPEYLPIWCSTMVRKSGQNTVTSWITEQTMAQQQA